ncbi:MAG: NAD-dependent deacylase [Planctomycetota bacterium]|nr:NAD-dependent deacylase [Planctomycetota bacterium]
MIDGARRLITSAARIVSFSGAGLSVESGVPTFRDAATGGLWTKHNPMRLASPQGFAEDPALVVAWYAHRRRAIAHATPNPAHLALAERRDMTHVTQNVDDLLHRAGAGRIIQLHGSITADRCSGRCGYSEQIDLWNPPPLRICPKCPDRLRPDVVWFGEMLPVNAWHQAQKACSACDLLLVIGTSAVVYPAAGLIGLARSAGAGIIIVNAEPTEASDLADIELLGKAGEIVPKLLE